MRPKRITEGDERPVEALIARGVQYVEARCIDINPFLPLGIDLPQARFLDTFLLYCALQDSPLLSKIECPETTENFLTVVKYGRKPNLQLQHRLAYLRATLQPKLASICPARCAAIADWACDHT